MGAKKKKKSKKKKEKKEAGDDEEKEPENPLFKVNLPEYNWIRIELRLCDPPTQMYNHFYIVMRSNDRMLELKKRIVEYHGKISDIRIYNKDPYPARKKDLMKQNKPRVPPFRECEKLKKLKEEFDHKTDQKRLKEQRRAHQKEANEPIEESDEETKDELDPYNSGASIDKYQIIKDYDFPVTPGGLNIVEYDKKEISLYEIFEQYGTVERPKPHHKSKDPPKPEPAPKPVKPPTPIIEKKNDDDDGEDDFGAAAAKEEAKVEEEPEEVWIPPVDEVLWYDYQTYKNPALGKDDPILQALMVKGPLDDFTL